MYWELWDVKSKALVETFETEEDALQGIRDLLAVNASDYVNFLVLGAMHDEGEPQDVELPPVLKGEALKSRLAALAEKSAADASREVHERIRKWLAEEGWAIRDVSDDLACFNIMVTLQNGESINLYQRKEHVDHITISHHWVFREPFLSDFDQLPEEVQRQSVWDIHHDVLIMGVDIALPEHQLNGLQYYTRIYFDGLTKDALAQRILLVLRALSLSVWTFARALSQTRETSSEAELLRLVPQTGAHGQMMAAS